MQSDIRLHHGVPTIFVADRPTLLAGMQAAQTRWRPFREQGTEMFHFCAHTWEGPGKLDVQKIHDAMAEAETEAAGRPLLFKVDCNAPEWWTASHPEELHRTEDGQVFRQSLASERRWLREMGEALEQIIRAAEVHDSVFGYFVLGGHTGEWFSRTGPLRYLNDHSRPMQTRFRVWLKQHYGSDAAIRLAWHDPTASIEVADVPTRREELRGDVGSFRDPARGGQRFADFYTCFAQTVADAVLHFCRVCKQASDWKKICGANYGHVLDWYANPATAQHVGHLATGHILKAEEIDFLSGPNSYQDRGLGGDEYFIGPVASLNLHGKVWYAQNDTRTHLSDHLQNNFGKMHTPEHGGAAVKRAFARSAASSVAYFWHDLMGGWYDSPELRELIGRTNVLARQAAERDRSSVAKVALVVDEASPFHQTLEGAFLADPIVSAESRLVDLIQHLGTPVDALLQDDLIDELAAQRYQVYLFANASRMEPPIRRVVREKLQRDGKTLVWFYAPGYIDEDGLSTEAMRDLTGIQLGIDDLASEMIVRVDNRTHAITKDLSSFGVFFQGWVFANFERHFGTHRSVRPLFFADDSQAEPLGYYTSILKTALAIKKLGDSHAIFCGVPFAPPVLLREICRFAGVHVCLDTDDPFWMNRSYVGFHAGSRGARRIVLPSAQRVADAFDGRVVGEAVSEFSVECTLGSTHLFVLD